MHNEIRFYKYKNNLFNEFTVKAMRFELDYETIIRAIEFINSGNDNNIAIDTLRDKTVGYIYVGQVMQKKKLVFVNGDSPLESVVNPGDYIIEINNGNHISMTPENFEDTFELSYNSRVFHAEWLVLSELGGQLYREYSLRDDIFIVTNNNKDKFIVKKGSKPKFIIAKICIPVLISALYGFINFIDLFVYPYENISKKINVEDGLFKSEDFNVKDYHIFTCDNFDKNMKISKQFLSIAENYNYMKMLEREFIEINKISSDNVQCSNQ